MIVTLFVQLKENLRTQIFMTEYVLTNSYHPAAQDQRLRQSLDKCNRSSQGHLAQPFFQIYGLSPLAASYFDIRGKHAASPFLDSIGKEFRQIISSHIE